MPKLHLKIVTPEKAVFDTDVDMVTIPAAEGEIGILPSHANLMTTILPGELRVKKDNRDIIMASGGGFLQVVDNNLTILTDLAVEEKDIDEKVAEEAKKRASLALEEKLSGEEYAEALSALEKSLAMLKVKRRHVGPHRI